MTESAAADPREQLAAARAAYERGDYRAVRAAVRPLIAGDVPDDVRKEARDLYGRVKADPAAIALALACVIFFVVIVIKYVF